MENQIKIKICGDFSLIPTKVKKAFADIITLTSKNTKFQMNICFAYNSEFEINTAKQLTLQDPKIINLQEEYKES